MGWCVVQENHLAPAGCPLAGGIGGHWILGLKEWGAGTVCSSSLSCQPTLAQEALGGAGVTASVLKELPM